MGDGNVPDRGTFDIGRKGTSFSGVSDLKRSEISTDVFVESCRGLDPTGCTAGDRCPPLTGELYTGQGLLCTTAPFRVSPKTPEPCFFKKN